MLPGLAGILVGAAVIGIGTGLITPLGFAALASSTPRDERGGRCDSRRPRWS
ncbi:hypothetical protein AB0478_44210 [Streptomyces sp. NPDC051917]|uniref:hypothetical protein n=1 Tax=Streptomyces sp. NPDC051917 TaxID=3154754 RepID=UPI003452E98B